jgi:hypothetical protein
MNPEFGVVLIVALLWGPTALWLTYSTIRGHRGQHDSGPFTAVSEPMRSLQLAPDELEALVDLDGFWVCGTCRSLNRREGNRCYSCRTAKGIAGRQAPGQLPVSRGVPVMAEGIARSSGAATGTTVAIAPRRNAPSAPETHVPAPGHLLSTALLEAPAGAPVCPFLGWRDDPSTRYDYPDPANLCHATSERGATSVASPRRILTGVAGTRRSSPIGLGHQESHCLTAAHEQCARYPAVEVVAANR